MKLLPKLIVLLVTFGGIIFLMTSCFRDESQPRYNGKSLSAWLRDVNNEKANHENEEARKAIRQIGTNAIPFLLKQISDPGELWNTVTTTNLDSYRKTDAAFIRRFNVGNGFRILGPIAKPAVPALIDLLNQGNNPQSAADALAFIDSKIGAAALADALTNEAAERRIAAAGALIFVGTNADIAVPNLIKCLKNRLPEKEIMAATLGEIRVRPGIIVPALETATNDSNQYVRSEAATVLKQIQASLK